MEKVSFIRRAAHYIKKNFRILIGAVIIGSMLILGLLAPIICKYDPNAIDTSLKLAAPSAEHIMGTDSVGRDVWARLVYGARTSILLALAIQLAHVITGTTLGLICGYYPKVDKIVMRVLEAWSAIPTILLVLVVSSVLGNGVGNLIISMTLGSINSGTRMVRAQVLSLRQKEFVERETAMGASDLRTIFVHILPHCASYLLVKIGSGIGASILSLSSLAYLGVGLPSTIPTWGGDVAKAQSVFFTHINLVIYPTIAIALAVFGFSMLGDGLRDKLDPKLR